MKKVIFASLAIVAMVFLSAFVVPQEKEVESYCPPCHIESSQGNCFYVGCDDRGKDN